MTQIQEYQAEINKQLTDPATMRALLATTFKGLDEMNMKKALLEGLIRGFVFQDFLEKKVYAIPFSNGYSLVTSIDYARAIGQKSGVIGKSAPVYEVEDGKVVACTVTIKKKVLDEIGEFTATVYMDEYNKGVNQWKDKPRTMIAKVAEMHALRMACPEVLDKAYTEDEMGGGNVIDALDTDTQIEIASLDSIEALNAYYKANKGKGKAFDKAITARKKELEEKGNISNDNVEPSK